jgi:hypothetical protein
MNLPALLNINLFEEVSRLLSFHQWLYASQHLMELFKLHQFFCTFGNEFLYVNVLTVYFQS